MPGSIQVARLCQVYRNQAETCSTFCEGLGLIILLRLCDRLHRQLQCYLMVRAKVRFDRIEELFE